LTGNPGDAGKTFPVQGFYSEFEKAVQYVEKGNKKDITPAYQAAFHAGKNEPQRGCVATDCVIYIKKRDLFTPHTITE
jgi:hypothetical protein